MLNVRWLVIKSVITENLILSLNASLKYSLFLCVILYKFIEAENRNQNIASFIKEFSQNPRT
ncbi:hypothetical protein GCM10027592_54150 [Spirosoma flavus]